MDSVEVVDGMVSKVEVRGALCLFGYEDFAMTESDFNELFACEASNPNPACTFLTVEQGRTFLVGISEQVDGY